MEKAVSLTYLPGRQRAQNSDQRKIHILSKTGAAASEALVPGDRAKICIRQFTALTRPGFSGTEQVLTNQAPWQGPSPTPPGQATPPQLQRHPLRSPLLDPRRKGPTPPPGFWTTGTSRVESQVPERPGPSLRGCQLFWLGL